MPPKRRIVVVDDEPDIRSFLRTALERDGDIQVVGEGENGEEAVRLVSELRPDLLTIDIDMPKMNGLAAIERIMPATPLPVLVVTGLPAGPDSELAYLALAAGALDIFQKPVPSAASLRRHVRALSQISVTHTGEDLDATPLPDLTPARSTYRAIGIGGSSGGPAAVARILQQLPAGFPAALAVIQQLPEGFRDSFAAYLQKRTVLDVEIVKERARFKPGHIYIAPDDRQLRAEGEDLVAVDEPPASPRPSVDVFLESLANEVGADAVGIILTGSGTDGAAGIRRLRERGALTIAQDEESSAVPTMPRAAADAGAEQVLPLQHIAPFLVAVAGASELL